MKKKPSSMKKKSFYIGILISLLLILLIAISIINFPDGAQPNNVTTTTTIQTTTTSIITNTSSVCGNNILEDGEECDDGNLVDTDNCSNECKKIEIYVAPYVGDIDGSVNPDWFFFFDKLRKWHDDNKVPTGFSFYPRTMQNNTQFNRIIADMYRSNNCELILKGENEGGKDLDKMSYGEVKALLESDMNIFRSEMKKILGNDDIKMPVSYNQLYGRFTETIRDALHDLGFKIYFELYLSELGYINPLPDFDITQYSVSFTETGQAGPNETFKQPDQMIQEILDFDDDHIVYINGKKLVPTMCHQQDFMMGEDDERVNQEKWNIYTTVLKKLRDDPRFHLLKSEEIYDLRHQSKTS